MPTVYHNDSGYYVKLRKTYYHYPHCLNREVWVMDEDGEWQEVGELRREGNMWQLNGYKDVGKTHVRNVGVKRYLNKRGF